MKLIDLSHRGSIRVYGNPLRERTGTTARINDDCIDQAGNDFRFPDGEWENCYDSIYVPLNNRVHALSILFRWS